MKISPVDSANWSDRDSTLRYERLILSGPVKSLVVVYGVSGGLPGISTGDTVTYTVPARGVVYSSRRVPVPWVETHLFRSDSTGQYREVRVAMNCDLHRAATHNEPGQVFGCWMPVVVTPAALRAYVAAAISDSAGLEAAYDSTMVLMNHEAFGGRMDPVPTWSEPTKLPNPKARELRSITESSSAWRNPGFYNSDVLRRRPNTIRASATS